MDAGMTDDEAQTLDSTEPPIITSHLAYFFVPLPDHLGLPQSFISTVLEETPLARIQSEGLPGLSTGVSFRFMRVDQPLDATAEIRTLFEVAAESLPSGSRSAADQDGDVEPPDRPRNSMTVVEMAVAVDLPIGMGSDQDDEDPRITALTDAFDRGLHGVREFQRAYYTAKRRPIRLVTRESLPFAVPLGVRKVYDDDGKPLPFEVDMSMFWLNANFPAEPPPWREQDTQALSVALDHLSKDGVLSSYLEFKREAQVAMDREGDYRSAVMFTATACEVLFDDLLAHMLWEEGERPEDAATLFNGVLSVRVKKAFHARLRGTWSLDQAGPIAEWFGKVARLRNRVVHGGYEPSLDESREAIEAAEALQDHLGDLVANQTASYPRTALTLPGKYGLKRRHKWTTTFEQLQQDPHEVPWRETFARWKLAMQRSRADSPVATTPSAEDAYLYWVIRSDGTEQRVVHDARAGMAAIATPDSVTGTSAQQQDSLRAIRGWNAAEGGAQDIAVKLDGAAVRPNATLDWVAEYRLVPLAGVMVHGHNLDPA